MPQKLKDTKSHTCVLKHYSAQAQNLYSQLFSFLWNLVF